MEDGISLLLIFILIFLILLFSIGGLLYFLNNRKTDPTTLVKKDSAETATKEKYVYYLPRRYWRNYHRYRNHDKLRKYKPVSVDEFCTNMIDFTDRVADRNPDLVDSNYYSESYEEKMDSCKAKMGGDKIPASLNYCTKISSTHGQLTDCFNTVTGGVASFKEPVVETSRNTSFVASSSSDDDLVES